MSSVKRYEQIREIGRGAFKTVILCRDTETNREVAFASPAVHEDRLYESFLREARVNALLEHPNIVPVYDVGVDDFNIPYFVMKVLDGETFKSVLRKTQKDPKYCTLRERLEIFLKVCDAMSHAHKMGIKHLDLKPENFQVNDYGAVHICDWGLAGVSDDYGYHEFDYYDNNFRTLSGEVKGTPGYMAPEQARGEAGTKDYRTDIFALGAVLYEILCFKPPFGGSDIREVIVSTCLEEAVPPGKVRPDLEIPNGLEAVALKAISKEPEDRYQTVDELKKEVESFLHGFATEAEQAGFSKQLKLLYQRNRFFFNSSSVMLVLIIALSVVFYNNLEAKRKESLAALSELKQQETALKDNLKKLQDERQLNVKISPLTAKNYEMEAHRAFIQKHDLDLTKKHCLTALLLNPEAELAQVIMARADFVKQEYDKALEVYRKFEIMNRDAAVASLALRGKKRNIREIYPLTKDMTKGHSGITIKIFSWQYAIFNQDDVRKIESDLNWLIQQLHSGKKIEAKVSKKEDGFVIDLRNQKDLKDITYFFAANISEIILSGTSVENFDTLRRIPNLKKLTIEKGRLQNHMESYLSHLKITFEEPFTSP